MKTLTLCQIYEVKIPDRYENISEDFLINKINSIYDIVGSGIVVSLNADYLATCIDSIDDKNVFIEDGKINYSGGNIVFLDGQPISQKEENEEESNTN